jgi:hypothetical protein
MLRTRVRIQPLLSLTFILLLAFPAFADSQARVVRLSDVQGTVEIDRDNQGFEKAFLNLPVTEGMKVRTGEDGRAQLEFEDNSALRLVPDTKIEIQKLALRDSGAKVSVIHLLEGTAYFEYKGSKDDEFTVSFARKRVKLERAAHLRIALGDAEASVAVFTGDVDVTGPSGTVNVAKNQTMRFDLVDDTSKLAKKVEEDPFDGWDKQQIEYQQLYSDNTYSSYSPYAYGTSDLNYYGSWYSVPGYGPLWQPYFTGAGWDPYMNGSWTMFPGAGYGWVSGYPWGWTPYNYGAWNYVPLYGWMWAPGGAWMGGYPVPVYFNAPLGFFPPRAPFLPGPRVISVNRGTTSIVSRHLTQIQIPENSAGLGIPRGSIRNLSQVSGFAGQQGLATMRLHNVQPLGGSSWWHGGMPQGSGWAGAYGSSGSMGHSGGGHVGGGGVGGVHH